MNGKRDGNDSADTKLADSAEKTVIPAAIQRASPAKILTSGRPREPVVDSTIAPRIDTVIASHSSQPTLSSSRTAIGSSSVALSPRSK